MNIEGTIGAKRVSAHLDGNRYELKTSRKVLASGTLWLVCLQRMFKQVKTCDVIYIDGHQCYVHTISQDSVDELKRTIQCPIYDVGIDPLPWRKFAADAKKHQWQVEDWIHLLHPDEEIESESSSDEDWVPDNMSDVDSDDED